jgi:hypothetical protein
MKPCFVSTLQHTGVSYLQADVAEELEAVASAGAGIGALSRRTTQRAMAAPRRRQLPPAELAAESARLAERQVCACWQPLYQVSLGVWVLAKPRHLARLSAPRRQLPPAELAAKSAPGKAASATVDSTAQHSTGRLSTIDGRAWPRACAQERKRWVWVLQ